MKHIREGKTITEAGRTTKGGSKGDGDTTETKTTKIKQEIN